MATEGMRFTSGYCSQPICSPSRAGIMTGKTPGRLHLTTFLPGRADAKSQKVLHPKINLQLPLEEKTLAEYLKDAGYATACVGKWHLGNAGFGPKEQGFDVVYASPANTTPSATEGGKGEYDHTAQALKFIDDSKDKPFFLYVPYNTPHIPLAAKPELIEKHKDAFYPTYAAMMETMDDCVGLILKKLKDLSLDEKTIVIFTSDNGGLSTSSSFPAAPRPTTHPIAAARDSSMKAASASRPSFAGPARSSPPFSIPPSSTSISSRRSSRSPALRPAGSRRPEHRPAAARTSRSRPAQVLLALPALQQPRRPPRRCRPRRPMEACHLLRHRRIAALQPKADIGEANNLVRERTRRNRPPEKAPRRLARHDRRPAQHAQPRFRSRPLQKAVRRFRSLSPHAPPHRRRNGQRHGRLAGPHERSRGRGPAAQKAKKAKK